MSEIFNTGENNFYRGDFSTTSDVNNFAALIAQNEPIAVDNGTVFAIWGNGGSTEFEHKVEIAKGRERGRTFGLSVSSEDFLPLIDFDQLHDDVRPLFKDAETFDSHLGAIAFVRVPASQKALDENGVPGTVISRHTDGTTAPIVQNWSPKGKRNIDKLLSEAKLRGVAYAAVTSLNVSGQAEITDLPDAVEFTSCRLPLLTDTLTERKLQGSFPILTADKRGLTTIRTRAQSIGTWVISGLLHEYDVREPDNITLDRGVAFPELEKIKGRELRSGLLDILGWSTYKPAVPTFSSS